MAQKIKSDTVASLRVQLSQVEQTLDGAQMRLSAYEAKINGQEKRLEMVTRSLATAQAKVDAWKEIALELIEERKDMKDMTELTRGREVEHDIAT